MLGGGAELIDGTSVVNYIQRKLTVTKYMHNRLSITVTTKICLHTVCSHTSEMVQRSTCKGRNIKEM